MVTKEEARLPDTAVTVLWAVIEMILSSAADISAVTGMSAPAVHRSLAVLQKESIVSSVPLGASRRRVARWRLVPAWAERLDVPWHEEWALAHLLARLPLVEWFYPAAAALSPRMGRVKKFLWFRGVSWDAAAQYENGWVMFLWSGLFETEVHLQKRLEKMGPHLVDHTMVNRSAPARGPAMPGLLCFVVPDLRQREVVFRVARAFGIAHQVQVWCVADGSVEGPETVAASRQWVSQPVVPMDLGGWSLENRLSSSLWTKPGAITAYRLLLAVAEWPGMTAGFGRQYCRSRGDTQRVKPILLSLYQKGLIGRVPDRNRYRHDITARGIDLLSRIDHIYGADIPGGVRGSAERIQTHERGLMSLVEQFLAAGLPTAVGWRVRDHWGRGGIDPDAVVRLTESPYGPGWHLVEYERSARGRSGAAKKLHGYLDQRRRGTDPVIFALRDSRAEQHFQETGHKAGLPLLTTTFRRLNMHRAVGDTGCWSRYGEPTSLG